MKMGEGSVQQWTAVADRALYYYAPKESRSAWTNDFTTDAALQCLPIKMYQTI